MNSVPASVSVIEFHNYFPVLETLARDIMAETFAFTISCPSAIQIHLQRRCSVLMRAKWSSICNIIGIAFSGHQPQTSGQSFGCPAELIMSMDHQNNTQPPVSPIIA